MSWTIGQLARQTGVPVKTLRFYSDEGVLPPAGRSAGGYRLYGDEAPARVERIRTLRDAGLDLATIRRVLDGTLGLDGALRGRLGAIEAELASLQRIAAAMRATLRAGGGAPSDRDLRRLCEVTRLSEAARRDAFARWLAELTEGVAVDPAWMAQQLEAAVPPLPDEPTGEQLDAWIELAELLRDRELVELLRRHAAEVWTASFDLAAGQRAIAEATEAARDALARDQPPDAPESAEIVERFAIGYAAALGRPPDRAFRDWLNAQHRDRDPRVVRYGELQARLRGAPAGPSAAWRWLIDAMRAWL